MKQTICHEINAPCSVIKGLLKGSLKQYAGFICTYGQKLPQELMYSRICVATKRLMIELIVKKTKLPRLYDQGNFNRSL